LGGGNSCAPKSQHREATAGTMMGGREWEARCGVKSCHRRRLIVGLYIVPIFCVERKKKYKRASTTRGTRQKIQCGTRMVLGMRA